ncbi:hypothetical protein BC833DRAFT_616795 [Globomyces pollinis-pini]|nr:hypothetical protein BC833DRAFT_616795 [Globomyces pollinis-pini]KAJ3000620.1 hypothetical protein HDV02_004305 [Globomyces sp. JEL0801]
MLQSFEHEMSSSSLHRKKMNILKKTHELSVLTGSQTFILMIDSKSTHSHSYVTDRFLPIINNVPPVLKETLDAIGIHPDQLKENNSWSNIPKPVRKKNRNAKTKPYLARNIFKPYKVPAKLDSLYQSKQFYATQTAPYTPNQKRIFPSPSPTLSPVSSQEYQIPSPKQRRYSRISIRDLLN